MLYILTYVEHQPVVPTVVVRCGPCSQPRRPASGRSKLVAHCGVLHPGRYHSITLRACLAYVEDLSKRARLGFWRHVGLPSSSYGQSRFLTYIILRHGRCFKFEMRTYYATYLYSYGGFSKTWLESCKVSSKIPPPMVVDKSSGK